MYQPSQPSAKPKIDASDRLGLTLFLALTVHAIIVLGVGFIQADESKPDLVPSLDVIIANTRSLDPVENPDYLAQVNQAGGGKADDKARPSAPVSANTPINQHGLDKLDQQAFQKNQLAVNKSYLLTQDNADQKVEKIIQDKKQTTDPVQASSVEQRQSKIARLQAEIRQMTIDYAKRPRSVILTASTKQSVEADYLAHWVQKIERIGNLNYPREAIDKKIKGQLRLSVRVNQAGMIVDATITKSSGSRILDAAAKRILRLSEPFPAFSEALKQRADQIVIIRTWNFDSNQLATNGEVS